MYHLVKETVIVSRYHIVKSNKRSAIKHVKNSDPESEYLESCDEIHWDDKVKYTVEPLPSNHESDLRITRTIRHIDDRLSEKNPGGGLTSRAKKPIIGQKRKPGRPKKKR